MSDDANLLPLVKGEFRPLTWAVECPLCGCSIEIECVEEDNAGVWYAAGLDTAPECPTCRVCVESDGIALRTISEPPWRNERG